MSKILYVFLDEGGNLDFSANGTKYFVLTALSKQRPFRAYQFLNELKYDLIEEGHDIEYFHASEDRQAVRDSVFGIIDNHLDHTQLDCLIIEKSHVPSSLQDEEHFYPQALGDLLAEVVKTRDLDIFKQVIVFTDRLPVHKKRRAIEKAIKKVLAVRLPKDAKYKILHHSSRSNHDLQIVDYCNWTIYRKHVTGDLRSYEVIKRAIRTEKKV